MFPVRLPFLLPGVFALAGLGASLIAGAAWAQTGPVADAPPVIGQSQSATVQSDSVDAQIAAFTNAPATVDDPSNNKAGVVQIAPRQIHGEAGVSIGSNGYRAGYISTDIPIGKTSDLGIAMSDSQITPKHFGTIHNQSLAVSLNLGGGGDNGAPVNCHSPTVAMDGRYLEPVWVSRMHGEALARDQMDCGAPSAQTTTAAPH